MQTEGGPIVVFDGVCNLCNGLVQFLIRRDQRGILRFASLQGTFGIALQQELGIPPGASESILLVDSGTVYTHSTASLRIALYLGFPWSMAYRLMIFPRGLRDAVYRSIAARRYRWFGKRDQCMVPKEEWKGRFLP